MSHILIYNGGQILKFCVYFELLVAFWPRVFDHVPMLGLRFVLSRYLIRDEC